MQTSYKKLWKKLIDLDMSKKELREATGLSTGTMTKLAKDEDVSMDALKRICKVCQCNIGDIMDFVPKQDSII
ncbi:MAG: helix-turn-helix transcriptional regulator [Erysipelotrichaceae bacterium]|nr:helix-turn-helix transcriptional regulator [Erysipelotrichaceae bacterium]